MELCYIAGPYTSDDYLQVEQNILDAKKAGREAVGYGWYPVIPQANTAHFENVMPEVCDQFWYDGTLKLLSKCENIMLYGDFTKSKGTLNELTYALQNNVGIFFATTEALQAYNKLRSEQKDFPSPALLSKQ